MTSKRRVTDSLVVCVESRKGGVGKTTAALCMARLLRKERYAVLVIDLDVTGTDAGNIAESPFWENDLHVIRYGTSDTNSRSPANLILLFDQYFMAGRAVPEFSGQEVPSEALHVNLAKVNILGSQIYRTDEANGNGITCIERPETLFDDLHTLWLLEFVKQISYNFARFAGNSQRAKHAIILDNSPGYVGIAPAVHDWLTDRGPDWGKFLVVTSLDAQDLYACDQAVTDLHGLYRGKWETSRLFIDGGDNGGELKVPKDQEAFFMQLASIDDTFAGANPLAFYTHVSSEAKEDSIRKGQKFCDDPAQYIAAIINRVPRAVKAGQLLYEPDSMLNGNGVLGRLLGNRGQRQGLRDRMISYDEYIENQFLLLNQFRWRPRQHGLHIHNLISVLDRAESELYSEVRRNSDDSPRSLEMAYRMPGQLQGQIARANDIVSHARSALDDAGLGHISRLIHDEWLPGSIVPGFRSRVVRLLRESDFPYFDMEGFDFDLSPDDSDIDQLGEEVKKNIIAEFRRTGAYDGDIGDPETIDTLSAILSGLLGLSMRSDFKRSPMRKEITGLFGGILAIELNHWTRRGEAKSKKTSIQRFLANESVRQDELRKYMERFSHLRFFRRHMMEDAEVGVAEFYKACTSAQARLIDFMADSRFLLQVLRFILDSNTTKKFSFPFVRGIVEDVIIKKVLPHEDAPAHMAKAMQTSEYFREFDRMLNEILRTWGVFNE